MTRRGLGSDLRALGEPAIRELQRLLTVDPGVRGQRATSTCRPARPVRLGSAPGYRGWMDSDYANSCSATTSAWVMKRRHWYL